MKPYALIFLLTLLVTVSCDKEDDQICGVSDPADDLPWLKAKIDEMGQNFSAMYNYQWVSAAHLGPMRVFIFGNCCPNCLSIYPVYNCSGEHVGNVGDPTIDVSILDDDVVVWKAPESQCTN